MCCALQAQHLEAACRQATQPLPVMLQRRRERASLHVRLLTEYQAALGQPPPCTAATQVRFPAMQLGECRH